MRPSEPQPIETDWDVQLRRFIPAALHHNWLRRTTARLRQHVLPVFSPLPLLVLLVLLVALIGRYVGIPDAISFLFNFLALVLLIRFFILSFEVVVANLRLPSISESLAHFVHGAINTLLSCLGPIMVHSHPAQTECHQQLTVEFKGWTSLRRQRRNQTRRSLHCRLHCFRHASCRNIDVPLFLPSGVF